MTDARDELAGLIRSNWSRTVRVTDYGAVVAMSTPEEIADAILAAGWRAPEPPAVCRHEGWQLDGNERTCDRCGERLSDDPDREPNPVNPTCWT